MDANDGMSRLGEFDFKSFASPRRLMLE